MRLFWALVALAMAGCGSVSLTIESPGGGGGPVAVAPSPAPVCPVDFAQALAVEVAAVKDRLAREALAWELRWMADLANAGSQSARDRVIEEFVLKTERLEQRGQLEPAHAARMRNLMRCYRGAR